ncbi:monovalent cation:proton antiporter-2 (CPA2) family protein [Leeia sp. TBRC 13508]|uniref:Monovalent cation:proton antiporter-2 (CPA2) family protein n=1 Tax=Leeia speluncae TaxID=2884804 RepID=A0ABS8D6C3_9NEIS|nr:monovalent cation:proton antiporter family protein [Leeia speluncae]MCB6183687.1 monovalent cation:proton antiporter-2 (CPA2) family protein [Leeia speluncae]
MHNTLEPVLLLLFAAVIAVVGCRMLKQPAILGYLLVGMLIGPHAFSLITENDSTETLGEIGVVFLMFSIGLEFSLAKLKAMRHSVFGLGMAQVVISLIVFPLVTSQIGLSWQTGLALGGMLAMSSTAIVSKILTERIELESAHGRQIFGILLFQDLSVVPLLILIPALATNPSGKDLFIELGIAGLQAVLVLLAVFYLGDKLLRKWFHLVASQKSSELFILNVLLITLGIAWLTSQAKLSMALGAFVAGMLISETEYRFEVEDNIRPFRDILLGLFFVTIGMKLDILHLWQYALGIAVFLVLLIPGKMIMIAGLCKIFKYPPGVSLRTGIYLAQAGEFGFVLLALATQSGEALLSNYLQQSLLSAMVIAMFVAPLLIQRSDKIVLKFVKSEWMSQSLQLTRIAMASMDAESHVLICGYGRSGQYLARTLSVENIPFMALDLDPERIAEARAAGEQVVFGDAGKKEALIAAGLKRASAVVIAFSDTHLAQKIISHVQDIRPELPIIVRTLDGTDIEKLKDAGAAEVVAELQEGSLMLASHTLMLLGIPFSRVIRRIRQTREEQYALFKGFFVGETDLQESAGDASHPRLHTIHIAESAYAADKTLSEVCLESECGVEIRAIRRRNTRTITPAPELVIQVDDTLVILGTPESLKSAEKRLLQGS